VPRGGGRGGGVSYLEPRQRLEVLARLPELIRSARDEAELYGHVARVLLDGTAHATTGAVVRLFRGGGSGETYVRVLAEASRRGPGDEFRPSRGLVARAVCERMQPVLHEWGEGPGGASDPAGAKGADRAVSPPPSHQ